MLLKIVVTPLFSMHLLIMLTYCRGRIDRFSVQPALAQMEFPSLHPLCIFLVDDTSETALASRLRNAYVLWSVRCLAPVVFLDIFALEAQSIDQLG